MIRSVPIALLTCLALAACASPPASSGQAPQVTTVMSGIEASGDTSIDRRGRLYVADFGVSLNEAGGSLVYRMSPDGSALSEWSSGFGGASGNDFGGDGYLYQSDVGRGEAGRIERTRQPALTRRSMATRR